MLLLLLAIWVTWLALVTIWIIISLFFDIERFQNVTVPVIGVTILVTILILLVLGIVMAWMVALKAVGYI